MPRPFTRAQALENARFLETLRQTGNARLSARSIGRKFSTMFHRRTAHAEFAQGWEAAAAAAHAAFHLGGGRRGPEACPEPRRRRGRKGPCSESEGAPLDPSTALRTDFARDERSGGGASDLGCARQGLSTLRLSSGQASLETNGNEAQRGSPLDATPAAAAGRLQLRFAHKGKLTKTAEQVFLAALSATANVRFSAAAAGASPAAFYRRRRQSEAFAREFRLALRTGWERLEAEALRAGDPASHADDEWREIDPPALPPLTFPQVLQLLHLHQKTTLWGWDQPHRKRRRGESDEVYRARLAAMWACEQRQQREEEAVRRALRYEESGDWRQEDEAPPLPLPPLGLVTGWSRASGRPPHREGEGLFGGWGMEDMKRKLRSG
jgi:hypothetical protein